MGTDLDACRRKIRPFNQALQIERDGLVVPAPASRKARAILGYLALSPRPVTRQRLCDLFFDVPDDPRASLRWTLSKLRSVVDDPGVARIQASRELVSFDAAGAAVDALDLLQGGEGAPPEWAGELLEDSELPERADYMIWLHGARDQLRQAAIARLRRLAEAPSCPPAERLSHWRRVLGLDPLDEGAMTGIVRALNGLGRSADAREAAADAERSLRRAGRTPAATIRKALRPAAASGPEASPAAAPARQAKSVFDMLPIVAVVPFHNYSPDLIPDELMDGFLESVIHMFSRFRMFRVLAAGDVMNLKGGIPEPGALRAGAGADYIVGGSLMMRDGRLKLRFRVVGAPDGSLLCSGDTERGAELPVAMLEDLPADLITLLVHHVGEVVRKRASEVPSASRTAIDHFWCGMSDAYLSTRPDYPRAMAHFEASLAQQPDFAASMAAVAHCKALLRLAREEPARSEAIALAHAAIAKANDDAFALALAGWSLVQIAGEIEPAVRATDLAIRMNPLARVAWNTSAWVRGMSGQHETAMAHWERAEACSPLGASADQTNAGRALCCWMAGRHREALDWAKRSLERVPSNPGSLTAGLAAAVSLGEAAEISAMARRLLQHYPEGAESRVIAAVPIVIPEIRSAILDAVRRGLEASAGSA